MMASTSSAAAAASLLQEVTSHLRLAPSSSRVLTSFLATASKTSLLAKSLQPEPAAFEGQSDGVIDMMKDLHDKMVEEKSDLEQEEMKQQHAADMVTQSLDQQIKRNADKRSEKASTKKG